jgi:hypothetical protein
MPTTLCLLPSRQGATLPLCRDEEEIPGDDTDTPEADETSEEVNIEKSEKLYKNLTT